MCDAWREGTGSLKESRQINLQLYGSIHTEENHTNKEKDTMEQYETQAIQI